MRLVPEKTLNRIIAHTEGVHAELVVEADKIKTVADARLQTHRRKGKHTISVSEGRVDAFVDFEGPHVLSVEFGHWERDEKSEIISADRVAGLHIITGAAGIA